MTTSPDPDNPDTEGKTIPPYDGRKETADVEGKEESTKDGVKTGGATGLVEDDDAKAPDPDDTERGAHASPADEQPVEDADEDAGPDAGPGATTGASHEPGTGRAEDKP